MPHGRLIADEKSLEYGIRSIEWAAAAKIPIVITGDGTKPDGMDEDAAFHIVEDRLSAMIARAEQCSVKIAVEPHGTFSLTLTGLKRLMSISASPNLGINYDAANIHRAGFNENRENSYGFSKSEQASDEVSVLRQIADRVIFVHAKDLRGENCAALGEGEVQIGACIELLLKSGYKGAFSLETDGNESFEETARIAKESFAFLKNATGRS
jgi:sugar phosphate isomerase/epimerase